MISQRFNLNKSLIKADIYQRNSGAELSLHQNGSHKYVYTDKV
jgi:hypothetical protein